MEGKLTNGIQHGGECEHADLVVAWIFTGTAPAGARVDLTCGGCDRRVILTPTSVKLVSRGAKILCNDCVPREACRMARAILNNPTSTEEEQAQARALLDLDEAVTGIDARELL